MWDKANQTLIAANNLQTLGSLGSLQVQGTVQSDQDVSASVWQKVALKLRSVLGDDIYTSWFARVELESVQDGLVRLSVPTRFLKSWISSHYMDHLVDCWKAESGTNKPISVDLFVRGPGQAGFQDRSTIAAAPAERLLKITDMHVANSNENSSSVQEDGIGSPLDPRYSFESFSVGPSNKLAHQAVTSMVAAQAVDGAYFNILCLYAPVGLGKTHLLQAAAAKGRKSRDAGKIVYLTAERFMYRFVAAVRSNDMLSFKTKLRSIELLLIDDMQFLQGKSTQQEFCHTLNELMDTGRQIIVAADKPPAGLDSLDERMRSRLSSGLLVEIQPFDRNLRLEILRLKLRMAQRRTPDLRIERDVLEFLADQICGNGRDLDGAFNRIIAHHQFNQADMSLAAAQAAIQDLVSSSESSRIPIEKIQRIVSKHFDISRQDIISNRRNRSIVLPRQVCMYLAKKMTDRSLPEIGRRFGGRDHTTVLHAIRKIEAMEKSDPIFSEELEMLRHMVEE